MSTGTTNRWKNRAHAQEPWLILVIVLIAVLFVPVQAALNPDFTGKPRSGVTPLTVQFNDTSTGFHEPVTYLWNFGDGNTSFTHNPIYIYNQPGSYTVTLVISNASGEQATIAQDNYITIEPALIPVPLNPEFTGTPRAGVTPLTVQFNDTSTGPHDHWQWDFGDGNSSSKQNPKYNYTEPGLYAVTLIISNASEEQATITQKDYITVNPAPAAGEVFPNFTGTPRSGASPLTVQFTDTSTGFFEPLTFLWDFGDGNTSSKQNPLYSYAEPGSYSVTLTIGQASGALATIMHKDYITVTTPSVASPLIPEFNATPHSGVGPLTVQFNDTSTGFVEPVTNLWDFGDGNTSSKQNPIHTYNEPGLYSVKLDVSNASGEQATILHKDYITVKPAPVANELIPEFNATPRSGVSPLTVQFNDRSTGFIEPVTYLWDFGDGNTSSSQNPLHTYSEQGSYTIKINITQPSGALATISKNNYITITSAPLVLPVADFSGKPNSGIPPLTVSFTDLTVNIPTSWNWSFGDDSLENATQQNPVHTFVAAGNYTVSLFATNVNGSDFQTRAEYIKVIPVAVHLTPPVADFSGKPTSGVVPLTVSFTDLSTNIPTSWNWVFGDDSSENATHQNPVHIYANPGNYSVSLNATNVDGSDNQTRTEYIKVNEVPLSPPVATPPIADFSGKPTSGDAPLTVSFKDLSTNAPTFWTWSFGDDSSENATHQNPVHTYTNLGNYTVSLNATNADGSDIQIRTEYIKVKSFQAPLSPPIAEFSGEPFSGVAPLTVTFTDLSTNTPTSWNWSFGDDSIENSTKQNPLHTYTNPGNFTVSLNVTNADGSDTRIQTDCISVSAVSWAPLIPELLIPNFTGTPTSGPATLTVQFNDTSSGLHNQWEWKFGDGNSSSEQNPLYTYNEPGSYSVLLNISQAGGDSISTTHEDYITVMTPLIPIPLNVTLRIPNFTGTPTSGPAPLTVQFNDTSTGPHDHWEWEFGDGNSSSEQKPLYTYNKPGSCNVTLNISQAGGETATITHLDYITVSAVTLEPPVADFSGKPPSGIAPLTVTFTDLSKNTPTFWNWSFGDDSLENATEQNPVHSYIRTGNYTVSLNATNAAGLNITTKTNYINVTATPLGPVANFSATPTSGFAPLTVQFNDISTGFVNPVTYLWDFGDGSTSTERNPSHTYTTTTPENYTVTFNLTGNYGQTDSMRKSGYITIEIPTIELIISQSPLDQSLLSNLSMPPEQTLPQAQSMLHSKSLPQAQSLPHGVSRYQDQSLPQDISTHNDLSAASYDGIFWVDPASVNWELNRGENIKENAFSMGIVSFSNWTVDVYDDCLNGKPLDTVGRMSEYNYGESKYVSFPEGRSLQKAIRLKAESQVFGSGDEKALPESLHEKTTILTGPFPLWIGYINLYQRVEPSDKSLDNGNRYRIVITFEASNL